MNNPFWEWDLKVAVAAAQARAQGACTCAHCRFPTSGARRPRFVHHLPGHPHVGPGRAQDVRPVVMLGLFAPPDTSESPLPLPRFTPRPHASPGLSLTVLPSPGLSESETHMFPKNSTAELESLRLPELQLRFIEVVGEISKSPNRKFLLRRIQETLAAQAQIAPAQPETTQPPAAPAPTTEATSATQFPPPKPTAVPPATPNRTRAKAQKTAPAAPAHAAPAAEASAAPPSATLVTPDTPKAPASADLPVVPALPPSTALPARGRFSGMSVAELQAKYLEVVGRPTGSGNTAYLIWKIREAEKGRITVGPVQPRKADGAGDEDVKVLPLRLETKVVEMMDAAWRERGIKTRMEFFRRALGHYLTHLGATEAAAFFAQPE